MIVLGVFGYSYFKLQPFLVHSDVPNNARLFILVVCLYGGVLMLINKVLIKVRLFYTADAQSTNGGLE